MIVAIYMPRKDAILLADTDRDGSIEIPIAEARAIAEAVGRVDRAVAIAREISAGATA